jgi:hypothetical protein
MTLLKLALTLLVLAVFIGCLVWDLSGWLNWYHRRRPLKVFLVTLAIYVVILAYLGN